MFKAAVTWDKVRHVAGGQHFGQPITDGEPTGYEAAAGFWARGRRRGSRQRRWCEPAAAPARH